MKYKFLIIFIILINATALQLNAQVFTKSKKVKRSYKVTSETSLQITNKYGNIHLIPWEKDSIKIEIDMNFKANKASKVEKLYSYIDVEITSTKFYIIANTVFKDYKSTFWSDVTDMANTIFSGGNNVQINYLVYLPKRTSIRIDNKFGNIYTTDHTGDVEMSISNGDFKAHDLTGKTKLNLQFANAVINKINTADIDINYSELDLEIAIDLSIISKSSTLNLNHCSSLIIDSKRDKYYITDINTLNLGASFTYFNLNNLKTEFTGQTKYGSIDVRLVSAGFKTINMKSNFTDIKLNFPRGSSYQIDFTYSKTKYSYPDQLAKLEKTLINEKDELYRLKGTIGKSTNPVSKILIKSKSGEINFFHK